MKGSRFVGLLAVMAIVLAACGGDSEEASTTTDDGSVTTTTSSASTDTAAESGSEPLPPITILINSSPWLGGFEAVVEQYKQETGNEVVLDVTPFNGMLDKSRNAVRDSESTYDILNLNSGWTIEFYESDVLAPLGEIDPSFTMPDEVLRFGDTNYWDAEARWMTAATGKLMGVPPNGNIQLFFYRSDLYQGAGLEPPVTWEDVLVACEAIQDRPDLLGMVQRGERGNAILFNFMPYLYGFGGDFVADAASGDYTVVINSPESLEALEFYIELAERCGPENVGAVGQGDMIQLLQSGKALQAVVVVAAWSGMDDPDASNVGGLIDATVVPRPADGVHAPAIGDWHLTVPKNISDERKQAALAFMDWFLTKDTQIAYAEAGSVPVRSDVLAELADRPEFRWMPAYLDSQEYAAPFVPFAEAAQVGEVLGLRLNQALIGELTPSEALNLAAEEFEKIFVDNGRSTGRLPDLP